MATIYVEAIPFTLTDGKEIIIDGAPTPNCDRFIVNLSTGDNFYTSDTALHFCPRFDQKVVVMNHAMCGTFGTEERKNELPFSKGVDFQLRILVKADAYQVVVNNVTFTFKHRIPKENVKFLLFNKDFTVKKIQYSDVPKSPVSHTEAIPFPLTEGQEILVEGVVPPICHSFSINLCSGDNFDTCDTALHFEVRCDEKVICMTHRVKGGEWGPVEKHDKFPFCNDEYNFKIFQFNLLVKKDAFQIILNNTTFTFNHRIAVGTVRYVIATGAGSVIKVYFPESCVYTVPHVEAIPFTLEDLKQIVIEGVPTLNCNSFNINLCTGKDIATCDTALHFNPRFNLGLVVLTHKLKDQSYYSTEERKEGIPFTRGVGFQLRIIVKKDAYQIVVNNTTFSYSHRVPKENVKYLHILGDITISQIHYMDLKSVPYYAPIPLNLTEGIEMFFEGVPHQNCKSYCLDLYTGDNFDTCDTALHFEVKFDEKVVSMTHRVKGGGWGPVEKHGGVPLKQCDVLHLKIMVRKEAYQIVVNNTTFTFSHRVAIETVCYLSFNGDIEISKVSIPDVLKFSIPHVESIPFPLTDGKEIIIEGAPTHNCNRFIIILCTGVDSDSSDIVLLFNPRFDENQVVLNHRNKGQGCGPEERKVGLPFTRGVYFKLSILVKNDAYQNLIGNYGWSVGDLGPGGNYGWSIGDLGPGGNYVWSVGDLGPGGNYGWSVGDLGPGGNYGWSVGDLGPGGNYGWSVGDLGPGGNYGWSVGDLGPGVPHQVLLSSAPSGSFVKCAIRFFCQMPHQILLSNAPSGSFVKCPIRFFYQVPHQVLLSNAPSGSFVKCPIRFFCQVPHQVLLSSAPSGSFVKCPIRFFCQVPHQVLLSSAPSGSFVKYPIRFSLDLLTGDNFDTCDIALRFEVRFDEKVVSMNDRVKGEWGPEEKHGGITVKQGDILQLEIVVKKEAYQIIVNNTTLTFMHRVAIETVRFYIATGDISVNKTCRPDVIKYTVPHVEVIPFTLEDGKEIIIEGAPTPNCTRFSINLCTGKDMATCDNVLHFNPRFDLGLVVLTHKLKDQSYYSTEERKEGLPFTRGGVFQLRIIVKKDAYQIVVNNTTFSYSHRVAKENVKYLHILDDVTINKIYYTDVLTLHGCGMFDILIQLTLHGYGMFDILIQLTLHGCDMFDILIQLTLHGCGMFDILIQLTLYDVNSVPYHAPIPVTLSEGIEMFFEGILLPNCNRFNFDLFAGDNFNKCDTALHFEIRFDERVVIMNHRVKGEWGSVEKHGGVIFKQGYILQLKLIVRKDAYQIVVNNTTFTFSHRVAMEIVRYLSISGDVQVTKVSIPDVYKYTIPYCEAIPFTLTDGKEIIIEGAPTPICNRFVINLCNGTNFDTSDIILHFNPRFDDNQVVLTHKNKGQGYGPEERKVGLPFTRGVYIQMKILVKNDAYLIYVNNTTFTFNHRVAKENVKYLHILGDITINKIHYSDMLKNSFPCPAPRPMTLTEGTELYFEGVPVPNNNRFILDLLTGDNFDTCNTALHLEIKFEEKVVSMTHRFKAGDWGPVEKHGGLAFKQGDILRLKIVVRKDAYQIVVNNTTFTFNHKVAIETVHYYVVTGGVYNVSRPNMLQVQLPYTVPIPFTLTEGKEIFVEGKILPNCNRFSFDLLTGETFDVCEAALNFEVRFDEQVVTMSHKTKGGEWGPVEKHGGVPFSKGDTLQFKLLFRKDAFKIFVNNTAFLFNHHVSMETVRFLVISSDVSVNKATFPDVINLPVSHSASIPFTLTERTEMFVDGSVPLNCNRFTIDLFTGENFDTCDTALHFEVRFDEKLVSLTHRDKKSNWGPVEKPAGFPFKQGDVLQLKIVVRKDAYQIIVNYSTFTFNHRIALETVRYLCISGDLQVSKVSIPDVVNVVLPISAYIPFTLAEGKEIYLEGGIPSNCNRFSINLCSGDNFDACDTALHFEVRFDEKVVSMTHRVKGGEWGPLEKHGGVPFSKGATFQLKLLDKKDAYKIVVNNTTLTFKHRIAMESVRYLIINGNVNVRQISFPNVVSCATMQQYQIC
ncbi:hypothetical protein Btru_037651 [Bulinus truncatus]|nr:hypothetical protein Btru_037651 [Bulinus truncatus]